MVDRKSLARGFLIASVLTALALGRTWTTIREDNAGTLLVVKRNGAATLPALDALLISSLISVIALFLLPQLAQRLVFLLTATLAVFSLWKTLSWIANHTFGLGPVLAVLACLLSLFIGARAMGASHSPLGPKADRRDPWRDLDNGVDPTLDQ